MLPSPERNQVSCALPLLLPNCMSSARILPLYAFCSCSCASCCPGHAQYSILCSVAGGSRDGSLDLISESLFLHQIITRSVCQQQSFPFSDTAALLHTQMSVRNCFIRGSVVRYIQVRRSPSLLEVRRLQTSFQYYSFYTQQENWPRRFRPALDM